MERERTEESLLSTVSAMGWKWPLGRGPPPRSSSLWLPRLSSFPFTSQLVWWSRECYIQRGNMTRAHCTATKKFHVWCRPAWVESFVYVDPYFPQFWGFLVFKKGEGKRQDSGQTSGLGTHGFRAHVRIYNLITKCKIFLIIMNLVLTWLGTLQETEHSRVLAYFPSPTSKSLKKLLGCRVHTALSRWIHSMSPTR